ncbi:MAG: site-specific DNA-methyltransferase [Ginsengibacter sp.]
MQNLYNDLEKLLKDKPAFVVNNKLNKSRISNAAYKYDEALLKILLSNAGLKKQFFMEVGHSTVFKQSEFLNFLKNKDFLPNSFTEYKNQIGLQDEQGEYYRENKDVVLVFPYKDCVLEGGQDKEEQKRNEIFYNETLAPDEITRLFDAKVLSNFKLYDSKGEQKLTAKSEIDFSKQNLIIKGNNLLALHTLKNVKGIAGQVKLIYIDPPYNTGNDSFHYNDKFNHSTWLVFMKNRLEIAKTLLSSSGTIFISIDHNEVAYMLALMDEIFGRQNRRNIITVKRGSVTGAKVINPGVVNVSEFLVVYSKQIAGWKPNRAYRSKRRDDRYNTFITNSDEHFTKWKFTPLLDVFAAKHQIKKSQLKKELGEQYELKLEEFIIKNAEKVIRFASLDENSVSQEAIELKKKSQEDNSKVYSLEREDKRPYFVYGGNLILFARDRILEIDGSKTFRDPVSDIWDDVLPNDLHNEGGVEMRKGKKPEKLIQRIMEIGSLEGELVLDFHLGSGTTAAVAHKMKRRYIGIEQLDYEENGSVTRLNKLIAGEQSGISKSVNWQGGGSFTYAELKRYNQQYMDDIEVAKDSKALKKLYEQIKDEAFFRIEIEESKWNSEAFEKLSLQEQKEILCGCLDKNHLYVNLTEMEDAFYKMSKDDISLNKKFYNIS